jgi:hypothetical protein
MSISLFSQVEKLNNYKYVIVSEKFDFVKSTDEHQTSSLTKFLLKKKGFNVFLSNEKLPEELSANRCLALNVIVLDKSGMFTTKNYIQFSDCYKNVIFTTKEGKSKDKEYRRAYHEGIRNSFNTMSNFDYSYTPLEKNTATEKEAILQEKLKIERPIVKTTPKVFLTPAVNIKVSKQKKIASNSLDILFAQPKNNGFQLVNMKPEVVFVILNTNVKDVFIIKDKNGIIYKKGDNWMSEYYENNQLIKKIYQIKF